MIGFIGWLNLLDWLNRESERIPRCLRRGGFNWLVKHIGDGVAVKENRHRNGWFFFSSKGGKSGYCLLRVVSDELSVGK